MESYELEEQEEEVRGPLSPQEGMAATARGRFYGDGGLVREGTRDGEGVASPFSV